MCQGGGKGGNGRTYIEQGLLWVFRLIRIRNLTGKLLLKKEDS
jgi:hypothetical protein